MRNAVNYTGRFKVIMAAQFAQLRKDHPDQFVGHVEFKYLKHLAVRKRVNTDFLCGDDKHKINVGEMGFPIGAAVKTRRVIVGEGEVLCKGDHDFSRFSLIPSVNLRIDIPETVEGSFYQGDTMVTIKCAITQPSSAARHVAESAYALPDPKPIRLKYHDGGCDRNDSHGTVVLANIAEFLINDLDYMVSMRCVPHQSYKDPAEHVMSTLNLGQQCLALAHKWRLRKRS